MSTIKEAIAVFCENWQDAVVGGVIIACAIIALVGILKKFLFNKISNKLVRKVVLACTSVVLVLPATALYFVSADVGFNYYWLSCLAIAVLTVIGYWLYEHTGLRNLISYIGNTVVLKYGSTLVGIVKEKADSQTAEEMLKDANNSAKQTVKETTSFPSAAKKGAEGTKAQMIIDDDLKDL